VIVCKDRGATALAIGQTGAPEVLIFYADENGDHSMLTEPAVTPIRLKNGVSPRFTLAGVGIRDTSRRPAAEALFKLKKRHFGDAVLGPWADTEIKGRYLFRAARGAASNNPLKSPAGYERLNSPGKVNALIRDLGLVIAKFRPLVFAAVVDKNEMLATNRELHPLGVAYTYLHQRIAIAMEDLYAGDGAIVVADQQTQHEAYFRAGGLHRTREILSTGLRRTPNYDIVLDKPLWVDTDLSSWDREIIQLADIVAYTANEYVRRGEPPTEPCYLWKQIEPCFAVNFSTGNIAGGGISLYPKSAKLPTA
jgi:hypothetical protein